MSAYTALAAVTQTLQAQLREHITDSTDPDLNGVQIDLRSPKEIGAATATARISVWLYRVTRNGDLLNRAPPRSAPNQIAQPALPVELFYLVTPITTDVETSQNLLGKVLQVFNDHTTLRGSILAGGLRGGDEQLRLVFDLVSLEDMTHIWSMLQMAYQLSVSYRVQVVLIDSDHEPLAAAPVTVKETAYTQIVATSTEDDA